MTTARYSPERLTDYGQRGGPSGRAIRLVAIAACVVFWGVVIYVAFV